MERAKIDLSARTCPNREERLRSIKAFYGDADELIQSATQGGVPWRNRAFQQNGGCVNSSTMMRLASVRDGVVLSHAPIGCSGMIYGYREVYQNISPSEGRPPADFHWISTNLRENDLVFGGEGKLARTLLEAEARYRPEAIFVLSSCASGIVGDDLEGVVASTQPKVKARIVPVHCEGFRSQVPQTGFDALWHAVLKHLASRSGNRQPDLVNLVAPFSVTWGDRRELIRLLGRLGLRANIVPEFASVADLRQVSEAALTVTTCQSFGDYLQKALQDNFGVPFLRDPVPIGISQTCDWLRRIAEATGRTDRVEAVIAEELAAVAPHLARLREALSARKVKIFVNAGQGRALGLPLLAQELGLTVSGISTLEHDELSVDGLKKIRERCGAYKVHVAEYQAAEQAAIVDALRPDIYTGCPMTGAVYKREAGMARMHSFRSDPSPEGQQFGFRGAITYGHVLLRVVSNPSLNKRLAGVTPRPYRPWWYQRNEPLAFVKDGSAA
jgi:nitrogenase molybdenum-iron protein alpha chain